MDSPVGPVAVCWQYLPSCEEWGSLPWLVGDDRRRIAAATHPATHARRATSLSLVRRLGSEILDADPTRLWIERDASGRPHLTGDEQGAAHHELEGVGLSISHTDDVVAVALALDRAVGIDLEAAARDPLPAGRLWMSWAEQQAVERVGLPAARAQLLSRLWTGKEAAVKALGAGLRQPLRQLDLVTERHGWRRDGVPEHGAALTWWRVVADHVLAIATIAPTAVPLNDRP